MNTFSKNGDNITWVVTAANNGVHDDTNVLVTDILPLGTQFVSATPGKGTVSYNAGTRTLLWNIPKLLNGEQQKLIIVTKVIDVLAVVPLVENDGEDGFINTITIGGDNDDGSILNNTYNQEVVLSTCPPQAGAVADPNACLCGNVASNDTLCSNGNSEIRVTPNSLVNLSNEFSVATNGSYNAMGSIINPFIEASFTYSIWCQFGGSWVETSGPAMVTIPALLSEPFVIDAENINFSGLNEYLSMEDAVNDLGSGKMFLAGLSNVEGWSYRTLLVTP